MEIAFSFPLEPDRTWSGTYMENEQWNLECWSYLLPAVETAFYPIKETNPWSM